MLKRIQNRSSAVSLAIQNALLAQNNNGALAEKPLAKEYNIKIANTLNEKESVFRLAYQIYLEKGFIQENAQEWLIRNYDFNPSTVILIVEDQESNLVGSVTMVFDDFSTLPAEKIYFEEIKKLRTTSQKFVELSRLVINPDYRNSKEVLVLLFDYLAIYSYHVKNYRNLIVEVNPRHKNYYKSLLNFDEVGIEKLIRWCSDTFSRNNSS